VFTGTCFTKKGEAYLVRLLKASDVVIQRHPLIRSEANPYEPKWESYYEARLHEKLSAHPGRERTAAPAVAGPAREVSGLRAVVDGRKRMASPSLYTGVSMGAARS